MVDSPSNIPPPNLGGQNKVTKTPKKPPAPGSIVTSGMPDPFPGLHMTSKEKKQFWNSMVSQMNTVIQKNTEKARKALKKLKESGNG